MRFVRIKCFHCGRMGGPLYYWQGAKDPDNQPCCGRCAEERYGMIWDVLQQEMISEPEFEYPDDVSREPEEPDNHPF